MSRTVWWRGRAVAAPFDDTGAGVPDPRRLPAARLGGAGPQARPAAAPPGSTRRGAGAGVTHGEIARRLGVSRPLIVATLGGHGALLEHRPPAHQVFFADDHMAGYTGSKRVGRAHGHPRTSRRQVIVAAHRQLAHATPSASAARPLQTAMLPLFWPPKGC